MNENETVKRRYCSKCGKMLHLGIIGDTCLTCLCGLDKTDINSEDKKK